LHHTNVSSNLPLSLYHFQTPILALTAINMNTQADRYFEGLWRVNRLNISPLLKQEMEDALIEAYLTGNETIPRYLMERLAVELDDSRRTNKRLFK
jgi:hypothetical protein